MNQEELVDEAHKCFDTITMTSRNSFDLLVWGNDIEHPGRANKFQPEIDELERLKLDALRRAMNISRELFGIPVTTRADFDRLLMEKEAAR